MTTQQGRHDIVFATLWMLCGVASLFSMAVAGREMSADLPIWQYYFIRGVIGVAIIVTCILAGRNPAKFRTQRPLLHLVRNLFHMAGQYGWFYGLGLLPLSVVTAIEFTTPVWVAVLAALLLAERLTRARVLVILLGLAGTLIILRPGLEALDPVSLVVLIAAGCFAATYILTKKLTGTENTLTIIFYMVTIQTLLSTIPALTVWRPIPDHAWLWLVVMGVAGVSSHYCITRALKLADAAVTIPIDFLRLPLAVVVGFIFYRETLDIAVLIGAGLVFIGNFNNLMMERRRRAKIAG